MSVILFSRTSTSNIIYNKLHPQKITCHECKEYTDHFLFGCLILAEKQFIVNRHVVGLATQLNWKLLKPLNIVVSGKWYLQLPKIDHSNIVIMWYFTINTDKTFNANPPDIRIIIIIFMIEFFIIHEIIVNKKV